MTESEAIKLLKGNRPTSGYITLNYLECNEALKMAINALEKQIQKKVILRHIRKYDGYDDGECPNCGMSVSRDCDGDDVFCPDCGQKLDWNE